MSVTTGPSAHPITEPSDAESNIAPTEAAGIRVSASPARLGKTLIDELKGRPRR
jgi:hypothetical protein